LKANRICSGVVTAALALALAAPPSSAQAMWAPGGVRLCQSGCPANSPLIVPDGASGAFVIWGDDRDYPTNATDVYMQHVTGTGLIAPGWPVEGFPVAAFPADQAGDGLAADGLGGALVEWEDYRNLSQTGDDPVVQRVLANGALAPGWPADGARVSAPGSQCSDGRSQVVPDGLGGAYVTWENCYDAVPRIYAQHLTASGSLVAGWPAAGLQVSTAPGLQIDPFPFADDSGGVVVVWVDAQSGTSAQRLRADGTAATGWTTSGISIEQGQFLRGVARDEAGGFYVVSMAETPYPGFDGHYYLYRFTFGGTPVPGWPARGALVCNAPGIRGGVQIDADGTGGVLLTWYDYRPPYDVTGGEVFALRAQSDGSLAPGWTVDGTLVSDPTDAYQSYFPFVVHDGQGGGYVVWQSQGGVDDFPSTIQHLTGGAQVAAGWPRYGLRVAPSIHQFDTRIATDGQGGAIVTWDERCCGLNGAWAQRFAANGSTPALLSLVNALVRGGRVELDWYAAEGAGLQATAYRRTEHSGWTTLGAVSADGTGHLRYEDRAVSPGTRYAYRLGYVEQGLEQFTAETWVEVPALALALEGLRPNPAHGQLAVSFALPTPDPARLELIDVAGRLIASREVGSLGAGSHVARLAEDTRVPAGLYWLRLIQGTRSLIAKGVVAE
jgi:hypothetical protein